MCLDDARHCYYLLLQYGRCQCNIWNLMNYYCECSYERASFFTKFERTHLKSIFFSWFHEIWPYLDIQTSTKQ